jgi:hypothetical protein
VSKAREWTGVHDRAGGGADNEPGRKWRRQLPQPQEPPQQPPPPLGADLGAASIAELEPACTATMLISGMLATLSHEGQTAASSRLAIGRNSSKTAWQSLQRYSYKGMAYRVRRQRVERTGGGSVWARTLRKPPDPAVPVPRRGNAQDHEDGQNDGYRQRKEKKCHDSHGNCCKRIEDSQTSPPAREFCRTTPHVVVGQFEWRSARQANNRGGTKTIAPTAIRMAVAVTLKCVRPQAMRKRAPPNQSIRRMNPARFRRRRAGLATPGNLVGRKVKPGDDLVNLSDVICDACRHREGSRVRVRERLVGSAKL